jgi:hypothetical protein
MGMQIRAISTAKASNSAANRTRKRYVAFNHYHVISPMKLPSMLALSGSGDSWSTAVLVITPTGEHVLRRARDIYESALKLRH